MNRTKHCIYQTLVIVPVMIFLAGCGSPTPSLTSIPPAATVSTRPTAATTITPSATTPSSPTADRSEYIGSSVETGVRELDYVIQIVLDGDIDALRSLIQYTRAACTFEDGLGGPPKCREGEAEGDLVEVLPFLGPEGHFARKEDIDSWVGIDASALYAVYMVSDSAYSDPLYPGGDYAIAFINEGLFLMTTVQIRDGYIVRVDTNLGNPPLIGSDDVDMYLVPPRKIDP